jgi:hypothetical protein
MKLEEENRGTRRDTSFTATLSTLNATWPDLGSNPGLVGKRPGSKSLSHGTVYRHVSGEIL